MVYDTTSTYTIPKIKKKERKDEQKMVSVKMVNLFWVSGYIIMFYHKKSRLDAIIKRIKNL